jgi:hypothetical protein
MRIARLVLIAVNWHLLSKIWCQIFGYAKMALLARRWHRWHVVGTVGTSLAPLAGRWHVFFFPDVI